MQQQRNGLTDTELIALVYYTDSSAACNNMKMSHRGKLKKEHEQME